MKLWIRIDAAVTTDPNIAEVASRLKITSAEAIGLCVSTWCSIAQHRPSGDLNDIGIVILDSWAGFAKRRGKPKISFGEVFLELFTSNGIASGWEKRQGALIERAKAERARHFRRSSARTPRNPASTVRNGTNTTTTPPLRGGWPARFSAAWTDSTKGNLPVGRIGRELKDLVARVGEDAAFGAWLLFTKSEKRKFGPSHFVAHYGDFDGSVKLMGVGTGIPTTEELASIGIRLP